MVIPHQEPWADLDPVAKRERLLNAARELFSREGLGASMPAVAAAAGAGVGSVYRQFADKDDLIAALVLERLNEVLHRIDQVVLTDDAWADFKAMIWGLLDTADGDDVITEAITATSDREEVSEARARVADALDRVMDRARDQGILRRDASVQDVRLLFAAVRGGDRYSEGGGQRVAELLLEGLRVR